MRTIETIIGGIKRRHPSAKNVGAFDLLRKGASSIKEHAGRRPDIVIDATTEAVDMEGDVIIAAGGNTDRYMAVNRNLFVDHDYGITAAVAHVRFLTLMPDRWRVVAQLNENDNEYQRAVVALAKAGTLAMSVGADFEEYGPPTKEEAAAFPGARRIIRRWTMLEGSFTAMPMNPHARMVGEWREKSFAALKSAGLPAYVFDAFRVPRAVKTIVVL